MQVWTDQALDFSDAAVQAKFFKPDPDDPAKLLLVDPSVAEASFGKPAFSFIGAPASFKTNKGSAEGEFTTIGELKRFRGPPKAPAPTP